MQKYFQKIVFAIKSNFSNDNNYYVFYFEFFGEFEVILLETPPLPLIEPLNKKCKDDNHLHLNYYSWKRENKYYGKQFLILGDSISTLIGYNPKDYKVYFILMKILKNQVLRKCKTLGGVRSLISLAVSYS